MKALIDMDVLTYEVGYGVMTGWEGESPPPFERAAELLDNKINNILAITGATSFQGYLTGKANFREKIAVSRPYKGNRLQEKPFHYKNLRAYMVGKWNAIIVDGMEADDAMAIEQYKDYVNSYKIVNELLFEEKDALTLNTIICTRDKDLRQVQGWHYGWELGNQPSFGPKYISEEEGMRFFYKQCLTGDRTDNIEGIRGLGPVRADKILSNTQTLPEAWEAVVEAYKGFHGDVWKERLLENAQLLWMVRELDEEGKPKMFELPELDGE